MEKLSIIEPLNEQLLLLLHDLVPSAERIVSVSKEDGEYAFTHIDHHGRISEIEPRERPYVYSRMDRFRQDRSVTDWLNPADFPLTQNEVSPDERDLFSEGENVVLLIRYDSREDGLKDLLFIYFRKNLSNFGISRSDRIFSPEHKAVVAYLINNIVRNAIRTHARDLELFQGLNENIKMLIRKNETNIHELEKIRENYGESLLNFCINHLKELSSDYKRNFILSEDAIRKIRSFSGNLTVLKLVLEDAAKFVNQVFYDEPEVELRIHEWELNFDKFMTMETAGTEVRRIDNRESRAMQLLDKLENAADEVLRSNLPLTSANVGQYCPTPITAPAITDALKKNRKRIIELLKKYPDKWRVIRYQFRPLKNLRERESPGESLAI